MYYDEIDVPDLQELLKYKIVSVNSLILFRSKNDGKFYSSSGWLLTVDNYLDKWSELLKSRFSIDY